MTGFSLRVNAAGLLDKVNKLGAGAVAASRPAAQAGAQVLYDRARAKVKSSKKGHWFHGTSFKATGQKYWFEAGSLKRAIYQAYSADNSNEQGLSVYHISWNAKKAPYGHMVEFGTVNAPAHPFLRPAFNNHAKDAREAMEAVFTQRVKGLL